MLMQIGDDTNHLLDYSFALWFTQVGSFLVDEIEESTLFDQLHGEDEFWWFGDGADHEYDVGVSVLGKHVDFVVEFLDELVA